MVDMTDAPVHRLGVSFSSHAALTRGLGKRARDAFLPCTLGSVETTKRLAQKHPRLLLRRESLVPDRKQQCKCSDQDASEYAPV